jgi:hypothetical protein
MSAEHGIPAATIAGLDLDSLGLRFPDEARQIASLGELLHQGTDTEESFGQLVRLLTRVGEKERAELLLRRNADSPDLRHLYDELFGDEIPQRFRRAVNAFGNEFGLSLALTKQEDFLVELYRSWPLDTDTPRFEALASECDVRFAAVRRDAIEATAVVVGAPPHTAFDLRFTIELAWHGVAWRLQDWRDVGQGA